MTGFRRSRGLPARLCLRSGRLDQARYRGRVRDTRVVNHPCRKPGARSDRAWRPGRYAPVSERPFGGGRSAADGPHGEDGRRLAVRTTESHEGRDLAGCVEVRDHFLGIDRHGMGAVPRLRAVEDLSLRVDAKAAGWCMPDYVELDRVERCGGYRAERSRLTEVDVFP